MRTITTIMLSSLSDLKRYYRDYLTLLTIPFLFLMLFSIISEYNLFQTSEVRLKPSEATELEEAIYFSLGFSLMDVMVFLITIYFQFGFAFLVHKITLGKAAGLHIVDGLVWRKKHLLFIKKIFLFSVLFYLVGLALFPVLSSVTMITAMMLQSYSVTISMVIIFLLLLPFLYFMSRISLVLPAAANNEDLSLRDAFHLSKNYGWAIMLTTFAFTIVIDNVSSWTLHVKYVDVFIYNISLFVGIVLLTNCYKLIKNKQL